ncbi:DNA-3-methyladenine glycosylase [Araneus ventricosus]|uniref:DNA-3-methyladenine glycosylase n=1 Tax=Araneus ventricosus TaxID=182803 RepID=A0A4Y2L7M0_ARAVE|nr:DNA-3-methyladenine glycosylase [Araneus ventricosus]
MDSVKKCGMKRTLSSRLSQRATRFKQNKDIKETESKSDSTENFSILDTHNSTCNTFSSSLLNVNRLGKSFFDQPCIKLAKCLLGKVLVRKLPTGDILRGRIVETECYLGTFDKASHSYMGKRTGRNEAMFSEPGTAYVYTIYGMYFCFNISSLEEGSAVLIRALEPLENNSIMRTLRSVKRKTSSILKDKELCNGPSKLCLAFQIDKSLNKIDLCTSEALWVEDGLNISDCNIITCKRIGIESAGEEWANKPLRFYMRDCIWVSVRKKTAESLQMTDES